MQTKEHSLCFTGHRSEKLPKTEQEMEHLKQKLLAEIDNAIENGIDTFYMGACYGFDLLAAQMVLRRKKVISLNKPRQNSIKLVAIIPFEEQASRWSEKDRELYFDYIGRSMSPFPRLSLSMSSTAQSLPQTTRESSITLQAALYR